MERTVKRNQHSRQTSALERQKMRDLLTPEQQLAILDRKFGKGIGATKERARLEQEIKNK